MKVNFYIEDDFGMRAGDSVNVHKDTEHQEIAQAFELWKDEWLVNNHRTRFQLINGYWEIEKEKDKSVPQWDTVEQCSANHCKLILKYVSCEHFGKIDGMDGSCHTCKEITPYQFHMCSDFKWELTLMLEKGYTQGEAIDFIQKYKSGIIETIK